MRDLRLKRGLGVDEVMHRLRNMGVEVGTSAIYQIEQGRIRNPRPELLVGLAAVYNAGPSEFPEITVAHTRIALDHDDLDAALASLRKALRARKRRAGPDDLAAGQ